MAENRKCPKAQLDNSAACRICRIIISSKGANTSNKPKCLSMQRELKHQERHESDTTVLYVPLPPNQG